MQPKEDQKFHIVMFPWLAMGHMTPFLHIANKLAEKGCSISFLAPNKAIDSLKPLNHHTNLIKFHALKVPHVEGLPPGTETASEIPISMTHLLSIAMDNTRDQVRSLIASESPKLVFYDMAHWIPEIARPFKAKTLNYNVVSASSIALVLVPARKGKPLDEEELAELPHGYPSTKIALRRNEVRSLLFVGLPFGEKITFFQRICMAMQECDAIGIRTCAELEGSLCDYIANQYGKRVLLSGPNLPESSGELLEKRWDDWLSKFQKGSVVFCAFGSQLVLEMKQFQELVLGIEMTGLPFFIALKAPVGASSVEEALPEGFEERVRDRGVVWGGWVQQVAILRHPSVGCFVNHCGFGSMWESLMSDCQILLVPHLGDQILNTRLMVEELEVAVEVERDYDGGFSKENLFKAINKVTDGSCETASIVRKNHHNWRNLLAHNDFMNSYFEKFFNQILEIVD